MSKEEPIPGLRDFMATAALSVLGKEGFTDVGNIAAYCYKVADAMLQEREKPIAK